MRYKKFLVMLFSFVLSSACGVKGKPQAPAEDSPIGRGRPSYQKVSKDLMKQDSVEDEESKYEKGSKKK